MTSFPKSLQVLRHGTSELNAITNSPIPDGLYEAFTQAYEEAPDHPNTQVLALQLRDSIPAYYDRDVRLAESGWLQFFAIGQTLQTQRPVPDVMYVSSSLRATQSLEALQAGWTALKHVDVRLDDRLTEQHHGLQELYRGWRIFDVLNPGERLLRAKLGDYFYRAPAGENVPDVRARVGSWYADVCRLHPGQDVLAIAHHGSILALRACVEDLNPEQTMGLQAQEPLINGGLTSFRGTSEGMELEAYNRKVC